MTLLSVRGADAFCRRPLGGKDLGLEAVLTTVEHHEVACRDKKRERREQTLTEALASQGDVPVDFPLETEHGIEGPLVYAARFHG